MTSRENHDRTEAWVKEDDQRLGDFETEEPITEERVSTQRDIYVQQLWGDFQTAAKSITALYKDQQGNNVCLIVPFKNAAVAATKLYHDGVQAVSTCMELGMQCGRQSKNREVLEWAKTWKRVIPRDDLIAFLRGRPVRNGSSIRARRLSKPRPMEDLSVFKEAVTLGELHGGLSNMSVGYSRPTHTDSRPWGDTEDQDNYHVDFCPCRQRKRTASPDTISSSPSRKRGRLT